jgi:hypothetical protein
MDRRVTGDPERLEAFTQDMLPLVDRAREAVQAYSRALAAFNGAQPNHLGTHIGDLSPLMEANLDLLAEVDRAPAAFAFGLRRLDDNPHPVRVGDERWFDALVSVRLRDGEATLDDAVAALDTSWRRPWEDGVADWVLGRTGSPELWSGTPIGLTLSTVRQLDRHMVVRVSAHTRAGTDIAEHGRWRPGWAERMNRIGRATQVRRLSHRTRWARRLLPVAGAGAGRVYEDWGDESLSVGDNIVRTSAAMLVEGGLASLGGAAGAVGGAAVGSMFAPGPGTAVGGVAGGLAGGVLGAEVGAHLLDNAQGAIDWTGDRVDNALSWGATAGGAIVATAGDLGGAALDTMADVGGGLAGTAGGLAETVGGWFGD